MNRGKTNEFCTQDVQFDGTYFGGRGVFGLNDRYFSPRAQLRPPAAVVARLAEGFGETRQSIGLGADNAMVEVFASATTGTWSITVTTAAGLTCSVASGRAFEEVAEALPAKGSDA